MIGRDTATWLSDAVGLALWDPVDTGSGTLGLADSPSAVYGSGLRFQTSAGQSALRRYRVRWAPPAGRIAADALDAAWAEGAVGLSVRWGSSPPQRVRVLRLDRTAANGYESDTGGAAALQLHAEPSGGGVRYVLVSGDGSDVLTSAVVTGDHTVSVGWLSSGTLVLRVAGAEQTASAAVYDVADVLVGPSGGAADLYVHAMRTAATAADAADFSWAAFAGSGVRSARTVGVASEARVVCTLPASVFAGQTSIRVAYGTSSLDQTSSTTALGTYATGITLTGLSPLTRYTYRIELLDSGGSVVAETPDMAFWTPPVKGDASPLSYWYGSCTYDVGPAHPLREKGPLLDAVDGSAAPYLAGRQLGDVGYEASMFTGPIAGKAPPYTADMFVLKLRQWAADSYQWRHLASGVFEGQLDDHEFFNNCVRANFPGGNERSGLMNDHPTTSSTNYPAGVTVGEVVDAGIVAWDAWFADHWLWKETGAGVTGWRKHYGYTVEGRTYRVCLDGRTERVDGSEVYSAGQMAWLYARMDEFAADPDASLLLIDSSCVFGPVNANSSGFEGWSVVAPAQYRAFVDQLVARVPPTVGGVAKRVVLLAGDKHVAYSVSKHLRGASGRVATTPETSIVADVVCSGVIASFFATGDEYDGGEPVALGYYGLAADEMEAYYDYRLPYTSKRKNDPYTGQATSPDNTNVRSSGVLLDVGPSAESVRTRLWAHDRQMLDWSESWAASPGPVPSGGGSVLVWDGTALVPATVSVWDGTQLVPVTISAAE